MKVKIRWFIPIGIMIEIDVYENINKRYAYSRENEQTCNEREDT